MWNVCRRTKRKTRKSKALLVTNSVHIDKLKQNNTRLRNKLKELNQKVEMAIEKANQKKAHVSNKPGKQLSAEQQVQHVKQVRDKELENANKQIEAYKKELNAL